MNDCERMQEKLGRWLDGELSGADLEPVRLHLEQCAECHATHGHFRTIDRLLKGTLSAEAEKVDFPSFWRAVERRINETRPWYHAWLERVTLVPRTAWAVPALIALVIALLSLDSYFPAWRGGVAVRSNFAAVDSIDAHGRSVALLRENETRTTVIWLYDDPEGEHETAEEAPKSGPSF